MDMDSEKLKRNELLNSALAEFPSDHVLLGWRASNNLSIIKVPPSSITRRVTQLREIATLSQIAPTILAEYAKIAEELKTKITAYETALPKIPPNPDDNNHRIYFKLREAVEMAEAAITKSGSWWDPNGITYVPESDDGYRSEGWINGKMKFNPDKVSPELWSARDSARLALVNYNIACSQYEQAIIDAHNIAKNTTGIEDINEVRRQLKICESARIDPSDGCVYLPSEEPSGYPDMYRVHLDNLFPPIPITDWESVDKWDYDY